MDNNFILLKEKLNNFINKYYFNLFIRGSIIVPIIFISVLYFVSGFEYFGWFSINTRFFLFLFSIISLLFFFSYFLFIPLLKVFKFGKRISNKHASKLLSEYFPEIDDKILNVIELNELENNSNDLVRYSINQKSDIVNKFDFTKAINYKKHLKLSRYLILSLFVFIATLFFKPELIIDGTKRVVHFNTSYVKDVGFSIIIDTAALVVKRGDNLKIDIFIVGNILPDELFIKFGGTDYLLEKKDISKYTYYFKNVNNSFSFIVFNDFFESSNFSIKVLDKPILKNYEVDIVYPNYINKPNENKQNLSEITVPIGSELKWSFNSVFCDTIFIQHKNEIFSLSESPNGFVYNELALKSHSFNVALSNKNTLFKSTISIKVKVIPDLYPSIEVSYVKDKSNLRIFYFHGLISDDFGFSKLLVFSHDNVNGLEIPIIKNLKRQEFYFSYEFPLNVLDNELYFLIYDNDKILGPKFTKSEILKISIPTIEQIAKNEKQNFLDIHKKLDQSLLMASEIRKDIEEIKKSLISEKLETWEKKSKLESLTAKHKQLENLLKEISNQNLKKDNFNNSFNQTTEQILEKQKQIQELLNNVMSDELKELLKELEKLASKFDENKLNEINSKLEMNYDDLSKELDKNLELLKKYEIEERVKRDIDRLNDLSQKQKQLSNKLSEEKINQSQLLEENMQALSELKKIEEDYNDILEKNNDLSDPFKMEDFKESFDKLNNDIEDNQSDISDNSDKSNEQSKKNSDNLNKLADDMQQMMNGSSQQKAGENAESLRQLLENLFIFSFTQEDLQNELLYVLIDNPRFVQLIKEQNKINDDFLIIKDSLYALSKRSSLLGNHISRSAFGIQSELINTIHFLENRKVGLARKAQREIMTQTNDMILLLSESLKKMDSMGNGSSGSPNKKQKPKKGKEPSLSDLKKGQEGFKEQLENMLKQMKGKSGKPGKGELGKMLAQQEIFQQLLNELSSNGSVGKELSKELNEIKKLMEANKRDLVNMQISNTTLFRQKQIMSRLLEAETAELERDKDDKRESQQALKYNISNPENLFEDKIDSVNFNEIFNTKSVNLFDFYKYKYQEYIKNINSNRNEKRN